MLRDRFRPFAKLDHIPDERLFIRPGAEQGLGYLFEHVVNLLRSVERGVSVQLFFHLKHLLLP